MKIFGYIKGILAKYYCFLLFYSEEYRRENVNLIRKIKKESVLSLSYVEAYQLLSLVARTEKVPGECAEVGVFMGGSAKLICECKGKRAVYLFDNFDAGLPAGEVYDCGKFYQGKFKGEYIKVKEYLKEYKDVYIYRGLFQSNKEQIEHVRFSFVHLDVDLYQTTVDCLYFFYPRMCPGGMIISHDYNLPGVRKAFDTFFANKPEVVIELAGSQVMIVRR